MAWRAILAFICFAFAVLSSLYIRETPYRTAGVLATNRGAPAQDIGAPDERQHANYILRLLAGEGLPVFDVHDPQLYEHYQSHQPPAYYFVAAGVAKLTGATLDTPEGGSGVRYLSTIFGIMTILGVFFAARWGLQNDEIALAAAAFCGFMPMFVALNSAISNDPMLYCLCSWSLALCALMIRQGWCLRRSIALGVVVGIALLTNTTALALLPMVLVAIVFSKKALTEIKYSWLSMVVPIVMVLPWWMRNQSLYGDPFAMGAFKQAFTGSAQASSFVEAFGAFGYWTNWVGWWTMRSFVGTFGYMDIFLPDTLYRLVWFGFVLLLLGWAIQKSKEKAPETPDLKRTAFIWTAWSLFVVVLLLFVQFNMTYFQAQARYLYPAIASIATVAGTGATALFGRFRRLGWIALSVALLGLSAYVLIRLPDDFARRTAVPIVSQTN